MKKIISLLFVAFVCIAMFSVESEAVSAETFEIGTYNIGSGAGAYQSKMTTQRASSIKNLIQAQKLDIVGLQEVDCKTIRNGRRDILKEVCPSSLPFQIYGQSLRYNGGAFNNGVIAKNTVRGEKVSYLTSVINGVNYEQRSIQRVVLEKNGYYLAIYNTHLAHDNTALRLKQIQEVKSLVGRDPIPNRVILGDLNASAAEVKTFADSGYKIAKGSAGEYVKTVLNTSGVAVGVADYIIVSSNIEIGAATASGTYSQSDHKMLKTRINVTDRGASNLRYDSKENILFTLDPTTKKLLYATKYTNNRPNSIWEYYPNTIYGKHGKNVLYKFYFGTYGNVATAEKRRQGDGKVTYKYKYYDWAKYGIHPGLIKSRTKV